MENRELSKHPKKEKKGDKEELAKHHESEKEISFLNEEISKLKKEYKALGRKVFKSIYFVSIIASLFVGLHVGDAKNKKINRYQSIRDLKFKLERLKEYEVKPEDEEDIYTEADYDLLINSMESDLEDMFDLVE